MKTKFHIFRRGVYFGEVIAPNVNFVVNLIKTTLSPLYGCPPYEFTISEAYN